MAITERHGGRQRRLRSWWRHEQQTVAAVLARTGVGARDELHGYAPEDAPPQAAGAQHFAMDAGEDDGHQPPGGQHRCLRCCRRSTTAHRGADRRPSAGGAAPRRCAADGRTAGGLSHTSRLPLFFLSFFFFFFCGDSAENNVRKQCKRLKLTTRKGSNTRSAHSCHHSQLVTVIPHDLMDRRDGPLCSCGDAVQQGQSIRTCSSAPEHRTPPAHQRRVSSSFEQFWHATDFRRGQTSQEMGCLVRKSSSHFSPEDNQPCSAFCPCQLWVPPLFPCAGSNQRCTIFCGTPGLRNSFPRQWAHESGVNGELRAPEQGQAINDDFESPFIHVVEHGQIEIANEDIRSDPSACFSADSCCHVLQWEPTTTQHPRNWTRRPMVAKAIKQTATSARANSEGKG